MSWKEAKDQYKCLDCGDVFWVQDGPSGPTAECPECGSHGNGLEWLDREEIDHYSYMDMYRECKP